MVHILTTLNKYQNVMAASNSMGTMDRRNFEVSFSMLIGLDLRGITSFPDCTGSRFAIKGNKEGGGRPITGLLRLTAILDRAKIQMQGGRKKKGG